MKYLGSPIAIVPKLGKNLKLGKDQAEEISDELMEFSLEDQEESKVTCSLLYSNSHDSYVSLHFHSFILK